MGLKLEVLNLANLSFGAQNVEKSLIKCDEISRIQLIVALIC